MAKLSMLNPDGTETPLGECDVQLEHTYTPPKSIKVRMATIDRLSCESNLTFSEIIASIKAAADSMQVKTGTRPNVVYISEDVAEKLQAAVDFSANISVTTFDKHVGAAVEAIAKFGKALAPIVASCQPKIGRDGRPVRKHPICRR